MHSCKGSLVVALALGLWACDVELPEGKFKCETSRDCPSGWVCSEKACYKTAPNGDESTVGNNSASSGGDGPTNSAGNTGSSSGTNTPEEDAGIDTTSCDAFTTFYRDSDGDGLGNITQSIAACSVASGYVATAGDCDDTCEVCTTSSALEVCDGKDNECNGTVDDGALEFTKLVSLTDLPRASWQEVVPVAGGAVVFAAIKSTDTASNIASLKAQRVSKDGAPLGDAVTIAGAEPPVAGQMAADQLDGKIVLSWFEGSQLKAAVIDANLSVIVPEVTITTDATAPAAAVAISRSASGGLVIMGYTHGNTLYTRLYSLANLAIAGPENVVYKPAEAANNYLAITMRAAPCLSGFYAVVLDEKERVLRVTGLSSSRGAPSGVPYNAPIEMNKYFFARPALLIEGGDCDGPPTKLTVAYSIDDNVTTSADIHVTELNINHTSSGDSFDVKSTFGFEHPGWVLPALTVFGNSGAFYRTVDIAALDDRYVLAIAAGDLAVSKGTLKIIEVRNKAVLATHEAKDIKPTVPLAHQLIKLDGKLWLSSALWSNDDPAALFRIGCN